MKALILIFRLVSHEAGHAVHASSINKDIDHWDKYYMPEGITEVFSIFFEGLTKNNDFLTESELNIKKESISKLNYLNKFMELYFITFYTVNSLMKIDYWKNNLSIEQASDLYSKLLKEYTGIEMPGEYWLLHHILPESIMYVPSYLIAAVRASELETFLKNKFGNEWWKEKSVGKELKEIMSPGAKLDLYYFSKLDPDSYIKEINS